MVLNRPRFEQLDTGGSQLSKVGNRKLVPGGKNVPEKMAPEKIFPEKNGRL